MSCERKIKFQKRLSLVDGTVEDVPFQVVDFAYLKTLMPKSSEGVVKKDIKPSVEIPDILGR